MLTHPSLFSSANGAVLGTFGRTQDAKTGSCSSRQIHCAHDPRRESAGALFEFSSLFFLNFLKKKKKQKPKPKQNKTNTSTTHAHTQARDQALEILDFFLKGRACGKAAPSVDVGEVVVAVLDVKDRKRSQSSLMLACRAWSVEAVAEALLVQGEHKAKQKAVPALDMLRVLVGSLPAKYQTAVLKTAASAAQMSDPAIRRAALEVLVAMHGHMGDALLDACATMMRPPILASLREMLSKSGTTTTPSKEPVKSVAAPPPSAIPTIASTPIRSRPLSQIPAPVINQTASIASSAVAAAAQPPPSMLSAPVAFTVEHPQTALPAPSVISVPSSSGGRNPLEEWSKMNGWIESQLRALQSEKQKTDQLLRRCQTLESENEELLAVAKELENEASKIGPSFEAIQTMTIDELTAAEGIHQEALAAIAQRKKMLLEDMARKSECLACSKQRIKSTVLFPCRHVVCSGCGVSIKNCPDCNAVVAQRFELPENVHV